MEFPNGQRVDLTYMKERSRHAIAARLLSDAGVVKVGRQLKDGDMVLMNRQVRDVHSVGRSVSWSVVAHKESNEEISSHAPL